MSDRPSGTHGARTDGDRTGTSNSGLKVPLVVIALCGALLLLFSLVVLAR